MTNNPISRIRQSLIYMRPRLESAIQEVTSKPRDINVPINVSMSCTTSLETAEKLLDSINELSMNIGDEVEYIDTDGEIQTGTLSHITTGWNYYISIEGKTSAITARWVDGNLVRYI